MITLLERFPEPLYASVLLSLYLSRRLVNRLLQQLRRLLYLFSCSPLLDLVDCSAAILVGVADGGNAGLVHTAP